MSRIPQLERYQLGPQQTKVYDAVLRSRGSLDGPFRSWLHSPEMADRAQHLGEFVRFQTRLAPRLREIAILVTARFWDAQVEWTIHEPIARGAGLPARVIEDIKQARPPVFDEPVEAAVYQYASELLETHFVSDAVFETAKAELGDAGITELTVLIGYYSLVAFSLNAFQAPLPEDREPLLPDAPGFDT